MSITISNLRIIPYGQKDTLKPVFGDTMHLTFRLADAPQAGDGYTLALDYERILLPTMRPLCAMATEYTADGADISFALDINTERFAAWASTLKKPTPIWLQLQRERGGVYTTLLLDDVLALPSVVDGANMVFPGTPLEDILENKADLVGGKVPLSQLPPIGFEQVQSDWDESDSSEPSYIRNKPEIGGARWGSITGDLSSQTDLADALDGKANLVGGKVPTGELPSVTRLTKGIVGLNDSWGVNQDNGILFVKGADYGNIDSRVPENPTGGHSVYKHRAIVPSNLDYAVRSVLSNVTTIPADTTSYNLVDASATTNNHSWQYFHAPEAASTYVFPAVTDIAVAHRIKLTIDFTAVQTYSFEDSQGSAITPLFTPTVAASDVYEFDCEYSAVKAQWLIWPHKQGAVSDDYVMQSQVGAANGVAGLDSGSLVPRANLPLAGPFNGSNYPVGAVKMGNTGSISGITIGADGGLNISPAPNNTITSRTYGWNSPIVPSNLNYAVTAALTDQHKISLTDAQKASAQDTLGIAAPVIGTTAPTTSTVGAVGQLYVDTATSKTYHCTAKTNTGTEEEPVWSYTWTDDVNAKGGWFTEDVTIAKVGASRYTKLTGYYLSVGNNNTISSSAWSGAFVGEFLTANNYACSLMAGYFLSNANDSQAVLGKYNVTKTGARVVGGGTSRYDLKNIEELDWSGDLYIAGGHQQGITTIPAVTSAYTLTEGVSKHVPSSASTYILPDIPHPIIADGKYFARNPSTDGTGYYGWLSGTTNRYTASATPSVGDNTYTNTALTSGTKAITAIDNRTHECILTVRFSSSVLTYAFEDADGNPITPLPLAGTIADGSVVAFRCTWEALLGQWVIMPVMLGTYQEVEP